MSSYVSNTIGQQLMHIDSRRHIPLLTSFLAWYLQTVNVIAFHIDNSQSASSTNNNLFHQIYQSSLSSKCSL